MTNNYLDLYKTSKFLQRLDALIRAGFFDHLPSEIPKKLIQDYVDATATVQKFMDDNYDTLMNCYQYGVGQSNLIYKKVRHIYMLALIYLITTVIGFAIVIVLFYIRIFASP